MRCAAFFLCLALGTQACAGGLAEPAGSASDAARLQGLWVMYYLVPGQAVPRDPAEGTFLEITGNQARFIERGQKSKDPPPGASFTIDPRQNPKAIDIHYPEGGRRVTWKGIYTLKEEEVRVTLALKPPGPGQKGWVPAAARPASFDKAPKDTFFLVLVLKRAKGPPPAVTIEDLMTLLSGLSGSVAYKGRGAVALSPEGKCLAISGSPGTAVRLWGSVTGKEMGTLRGHDSEVMTVVFSRDGKRLFAATATEVRVWAVPAGKLLQRIPAGGVRGDGRLTLSDDEKWFVSDPDTEQKIAPDGRFVLATVRLWEVGTGKEAHRLEITRTTGQMVGQYLDYFVGGKGSDEVVGTALSHDGKWVAAGTQRGEVHLWNGATGKTARTFGRRSDNAAVPVGFNKDGQLLVTFNLALTWTKYRQAVRVWEVATGKEKHAIEGAALAPGDLGRRDMGPSVTDDGKWLLWVTGAAATTPRIWEVETGKEVRAFVGHKQTVTHGWVSRDKKLLATYDLGGGARLWEVATGKELRVLDVRPQPVGGWRSEDFQVRVSPDLKVLVAWSASRLTVWDLANGKAIRSMRR
jgi:uncharacterized protein (TIGR03067 family)